MVRASLIATSVLLSIALSAPSHAGEKAKPRYDPDEKICEKIDMIGTRLGSRRVCATRAEWADRRRQEREVIDRAQLSPCVLTHTTVGANGNGHQSC